MVHELYIGIEAWSVSILAKKYLPESSDVSEENLSISACGKDEDKRG